MLNMEVAETEEKIHETCYQNKLKFTFESVRFPIVAKLRPGGEIEGQVSMETGEIKDMKYGEIQFVFGDELTMKFTDDFKIEDKLLNKIKNQVKKLHYLYLQMYFKEKTQINRGNKND